MHTDLSRRINRLIRAADNISPTALKSELLDLARHCEVVPENRFLFSTVCGPLEGAASSVFGNLGLLLVLTEPRRRQVYFAVMARLEADGAFEAPGLDEAARAVLLCRLAQSPDKQLIAQAYGSCPVGFLCLISRFGDCARKPEIYTGLFDLLDAHPELAQPLLGACQSRPLTDDMIALAHTLPPTPLGVSAAARFETTEECFRFLRPYQVITGNAQLTEAHLRRIADGEAPGNLLEGIYLDLPFPAPVLEDPELIHIPDGRALVKAAREFSNCLADYADEALRNEHQYYVYVTAGEPKVIFSIRSDKPFGWYLSEARLASNKRVNKQQREALKALLQTKGVRTNGSVENLIRPYHQGDTGFIINDLEEPDEAA